MPQTVLYVVGPFLLWVAMAAGALLVARRAGAYYVARLRLARRDIRRAELESAALDVLTELFAECMSNALLRGQMPETLSGRMMDIVSRKGEKWRTGPL